MEDIITKVIAKVREIGKNNPILNDVVNQTAQIHVSENKDTGNFEVDYIKFCFHDSVVTVSETRIVHYPEYGAVTLYEYEGWENLLNME